MKVEISDLRCGVPSWYPRVDSPCRVALLLPVLELRSGDQDDYCFLLLLWSTSLQL